MITQITVVQRIQNINHGICQQRRFSKSLSIFTLMIFLFTLSITPYLVSDVFGDKLDISSWVANDPDDGDAIYSDGGYDNSHGLTNTPSSVFTGGFDLFVAVTTSGEDGCDGDCQELTLGVTSDDRRLVDNGFSYNGKAIGVERFFTPYPLVTVDVGVQNVAQFKIYENEGPDNVSNFELVFGLADNQSIGVSKVVINWDKSRDGIETIDIVDPEHVLEEIAVITFYGDCSDESKQQCLIIKIFNTFRAPLDFNIVAADVWDIQRNIGQNNFNHGIEVTGESINTAKEYDGINVGIVYHPTEISKTTVVDEFGDSWTLKNGVWNQDYVLPDKVRDSNWNVMNRMHSDFADYKEIQAQKAIEQLLEICPSCLDSFTDFKSSFSYETSNKINKLDNQETIQKMLLENESAQKIMNKLLELNKFNSTSYTQVTNEVTNN